ncbi:MSMEG_1061 family FMN-dependent PPOX-type flavoprotein [Roseicella aerolata]|uniref:Pyridoxamine 5'-phosphate oxidase family protein n=1 Tax=Roseicella aerolata TaxID=2883479 RepID=A0A9X1IIJ7_9PROT|nr:MSMEG_1061 family FMN-dependent PPOX-type flavoprotein [Roseicella aerolata]MCB4825289.1 pyridoxamine 5'-phosphate oxidase family protein [Roseicella aerolata]
MTGPDIWLDGAHALDSVDALRRHYPLPHEVVLRKQIARLDVYCRRLIAASPFLVLASSGPTGVDCSPRGGAPGLAQVHDETTLLLPDQPGNNRLDSLRNIIANPAVGLLFLLPGLGEVLRVNGRAAVSVHPALLERFAENGRPPRAVLVIRVEEAFVHCPRALIAAGLWDPARHLPAGAMPSLQEVLAAHLALADEEISSQGTAE